MTTAAATLQPDRGSERLLFVTEETPLGVLLMAATPRGVCHVALGDDLPSLVTALQEDFPLAQLEPLGGDATALAEWMAALVAHLEGETPCPALPLDLRGTPFQQKVWRALQQLPAGAVVSYASLARAIGQPTAVRAVGSACGANRVAVLIPCHRAVRTDGALGGFRWGLERKRALLARERGEFPLTLVTT